MRRRGPRCSGAGRATCRRHGPASIWPSDWSRTGRAISGSSRRPGSSRRTTWRSRRSGVVIDRRITQGTRRQRGDRWCERIWTVMATCGQQGRSVFAYLESAVTAWFPMGRSPRRCYRANKGAGRDNKLAEPSDARSVRTGKSPGRRPSRASHWQRREDPARGGEQGEDRCRNGRCALVGEWTGARGTQCAITLSIPL